MNEGNGFYMYVSTRACYDPAKTIFVFAPGEEAMDMASAERFAVRSGWQALSEYDGAVLILPLAPMGWEREVVSLPGRIYELIRGGVESRNGKSLFGRGGKIWCWETMIYLVGYSDGAVFAGNCLVAEPGRFAAAALIGGAPEDYSAGKKLSGHWMVSDVSDDDVVRNDQIPCSLWLIGAQKEEIRRALDYFGVSGGLGREPKQVSMGMCTAVCYENEANPAQRLMVSEGPEVSGMALAHTILDAYFDRTVRWKTGPDGTLALHLGRTGFYQSNRFIHGSVTVGYLEYAYSVHLPEGCSAEDVRGLPLLFSVHGRGEPAWLFAEKNGWDVLADETRAFVLVCPDSPGNIWQLERDGLAFEAMIAQICGDYRLDRTRVYLTGFSNGGAITREVGTTWPELFAAIAPFNAPVNAPGLVAAEVVNPVFLSSGYELPYWVCVGDRDPAAGTDVDGQLEVMLAANRWAGGSEERAAVRCGGRSKEMTVRCGGSSEERTAVCCEGCSKKDRAVRDEGCFEESSAVCCEGRPEEGSAVCCEIHSEENRAVRSEGQSKEDSNIRREAHSKECRALPTNFLPDEIRTDENYYTASRGYHQGDRFKTLVYHGPDGLPRVAFTIMKNMPHGAIPEQSWAAWEFLRHFRRPAGSRQVEYLTD